MGNKFHLVIDLDRCWGCRACEVACKQELGLGTGPRPMQVVEIGPRTINGSLHKDYIPVMCQHCQDPQCREACPQEAIYRADDDSVQIDSDLCDHCGVCEPACPYGAIQIADEGGPVKCSLCFSRRNSGWLPSCAQHCEGRAFSLVADNDIDAFCAKKYSWSDGQVVYISNKWNSLGKGLTKNP